MGYDASKDKILKESKFEDKYNNNFRVAICQYDDGDKKIAIQKENPIKNGQVAYTSKVGRLFPENAKQVADAIYSMLENMEY